MEPTTTIYLSKLEYYQAELKKTDDNLSKENARKKELQSLINGELPTLMDMKSKKKADQRDQEDL